MSYGFSTINTAGQVIISDEMENLHFVGKATLSGNDGGNYGDFPEYGSVQGLENQYDSLDGRVIFTYTITTSGTPLVFIKPSDYTRWHAVLTQSYSGNNWTFKVIASGLDTSNAPSLYCFVNANNVPASSDNWGLLVQKSSTVKTFDSRLSPLAVDDGGSIVPPADPTDSAGLPTSTSGHSWNDANLDHDFRSTTRYNSDSLTTNLTYTDLMFSAPSLAQAVYQRQKDGYKRSCGDYGCCCQDHYSTALWWVFYRNTFRIRSGYFDAGWTNFAAGFAFSSNFEGGGWFGGGGGSFSTGSAPYSPKTINLTSNAYIIADSTRYD